MLNYGPLGGSSQLLVFKDHDHSLLRLPSHFFGALLLQSTNANTCMLRLFLIHHSTLLKLPLGRSL